MNAVTIGNKCPSCGAYAMTVRDIVTATGTMRQEKCEKCRHLRTERADPADPEPRAMSWDAILERMTKWQVRTFPTATVHSCASHILKEAKEIIDGAAANEDRGKLLKEFVDVLFLVNQGRRSLNASMEEFKQAVDAKQRENEGRKWGKPDKDGVVEHVRTHDTNEPLPPGVTCGVDVRHVMVSVDGMEFCGRCSGTESPP